MTTEASASLALALLLLVAGANVLGQLAVRLRQLVDKDGAVVGTKSGLKENPAARLELAARAFICRTLGRLGVLSEPLRDGPGRPPTFGGV